MRKITLIALTALSLSACHHIKEKGKETINDAGKVVGQGTSQFVSGVAEGVDKTFKSTIVLSDSLKSRGLSTGKYSIEHEYKDTAYRISLYCIFAKDVDRTVYVKAYDEKGVEYGRTKLHLTGKANDAHYVDILFDSRTQLESKSKFTLE
jgi:hypothetical protein